MTSRDLARNPHIRLRGQAVPVTLVRPVEQGATCKQSLQVRKRPKRHFATAGLCGFNVGATAYLILPIVTVAETNKRSSEHWSERKRRVDAQHTVTRAALSRVTLPPLPVRITFVRIAPRKLDAGDNCNSSAKSIRDAIAKAYNANDGSDDFDFTYGQTRADGFGYFVRIEPKETT